MADVARELTLYIQSKKTVTMFFRPPAQVSPPGIGGPMTQTSVSTLRPDVAEAPGGPGDAPVYFLSDDQSRALAMTEEFAGRRGYQLKVVDVEKAGRLERLVTEHLRGVQTFPVLVAPSGQRLAGAEQFTEENLAAMMPTELNGVRALTYVKIKGGDLDRIRRMLEGLGEVKELHFLTGDWDILVVLDFPASGTNKRRILDFVTERIRGIPEVLDTSTLVPEYSVTKFP